jgi:uncharacterized protein DUF6252
MKKQFILYISLCLLGGVILLSGCGKDTATPEEDPSTPTPVSTGGFSWTPSGGSQVVADSTHYYSSFTTIFAFKNGNANSFEINLSSLAVGAYTLSSATGNALSFVTSSTTYTAHTGSVFITTNNGSKLSGTFNATLNGGTITSVSGQFKDVPGRN